LLGALSIQPKNGDKWYGNFLGNFPENPEIVEFPKGEPFNQKGKSTGTEISENSGILPRELVQSFEEI